ncbi:MAG: hypothetical protein IPM80_02335 [Proteobacteria bacterium]|nr:hypothetical protein [Pseudomonadota bacterium]MBK8957283.1 hypothetical protein [Pseudomonadota bacterium]
MNNNIKTLCLLAAGALGVAGQAQAALYSGEVANLRNAAGVLAGDNDADASGNAWAATGSSATNKGVRLSYTVDQVSANDWAYSYTFIAGSTAQKQVARFDLEVGSLFNAASLISASCSVVECFSPAAGLTTSAIHSAQVGLVSAPQTLSLSGLEWIFPANTFAFTVTLHSTLGPIWGDFIVKSSETTANPPTFLAAWNHGFGADVATAIVTGNDAAGYVLVPGAPAPVPLPASLPLLLGACAALGWARRKAA